MIKRELVLAFIVATLLIFLGACAPSTPEETQAADSPTEVIGTVPPAYPASTNTPVPPADAPYPASRPTQPAPYISAPYPVETSTPGDSGIIRFTLNRPIIEGATEVSGTGPPGVPILILDVTFVGDFVGQGTIGPDGTFVITVSALEKGHRLGIALGDLTGTQWTPEDFKTDGPYAGEGAYNAPNIGKFLDTVMVEAEQ